jgi:RNA polymerase sigma factor (sigma-70 family)
MSHGSLTPVLHFLRRAVTAEDEATDGQLLQRFVATREEAAFAGLVRRHSALVLSVCRRILNDGHDAEDAFQGTFLVLARKAASIRKRQSVAAWLHGVACRVARKARAAAARRHVMTGQVTAMSNADPAAEAAGRELRPLLDEELSRLPEKYRAPLVLCYLEGLTTEEVAQRLGWPRGTVSGRLARARDLLRNRLARRGLALSGAALAALLAENAATAAPAALTAAAIEAAVNFARGTAATASPAALALAEGVLTTMRLTRLTLIAVMALALAGSAAGLLGQVYRSGRTAAKEPPGRAEPPGVVFGRLDRPPDDRERLQGTWIAVTIEINGQKVAPEPDRPFRVVVKGDRITFNPDTDNRVSTFKLDPDKKPRAILLTPQDGPAKGRTVEGIYAIDPAGRLSLCFDNTQGKTRPAEFATAPGSGLTLLVLERQRETAGAPAPAKDEALLTLTGSGAAVRSVAFSPDARAIAACAEDGSTHVWDARTGKLRVALRGTESKAQSLAVSPDGRLIAVCAMATRDQKETGEVMILDATTGKVVRTLAGHDRPVNAVAFSPDGRWLVSAGQDRTTRLWDAATGRVLMTLRVAAGTAAATFSPDGKLLVSAGADGTVRLWDAATGWELMALAGHTGGVASVAFSPDGRLLASAGSDETARLWDVRSGKEVRRIVGHKKAIHAVAFSPDGKLLATAGDDGTVRLWNAATGEEVKVFQGHNKAVFSVAFSPDGTRLASGSADGTVKIWAVPR